MRFLILFFLISLYASSVAQWDVNNFHAAFRYLNNTDEWSHWTTNELRFWTNTTYQTGSTLTPNSLIFFDNPGGFMLDRLRLDYNGFNLMNGASWNAAKLGLNGSAGEMELTNGSGVLLTEINQNGMWLYGSNAFANVYCGSVGGPSGSLNRGQIALFDDAGVIQAGIFVDEFGNGIVYGDTKSFAVDHPTKPDKDIWYASIEGPEVAIYERGSAKVVNGQAFVPYSEHFAELAALDGTTVMLTVHHWDTYGLAVTEKTSNGFFVKELKGGKGNFSFDWESKSVRKGRENFQVIRPKNYAEQLQPVRTSELRISNAWEDQRKTSKSNHPDCVLHKK